MAMIKKDYWIFSVLYEKLHLFCRLNPACAKNLIQLEALKLLDTTSQSILFPETIVLIISMTRKHEHYNAGKFTALYIPTFS